MIHPKKMWLRALIVGCVCMILTVSLSAFFWQVSKVQVATELETKRNTVISDYGEEASRARMSLVTEKLLDQIFESKKIAESLVEQVSVVLHNERMLEEDKREQMIKLSKDALHASSVILGIYTNFVEDALGDDSKFIGREDYASNEKGRFTPYFTAAGETGIHTQIMTEKDFEVEETDQFGYEDNHWYTCVFKIKRPCLVQPYKDFVQGKEYFMISLAIPVFSLDKREVVGVVGVDISLRNISKMLSVLDRTVFNGEAEITLLNKHGQIIGDSDHPKTYGRLIGEVSSTPERYNRLSAAGVPGSVTDPDTGEMLLYTPFKLIDNETVLELFAKIPLESIESNIEALNGHAVEIYSGNVFKFIQAGLVVLLLFLVGLWYFFRRYLKRPDDDR